MTRDDGFPVMDVSTSILDDPKFRRIQRDEPELVAPAFTAYVATMAESWKAGRRTTVVDAWPALMAFAPPVVEALQGVGLIDRGGQIPAKTWNGWFKPAKKRRDDARDRWRRANEKRANSRSDGSVVASSAPRGNSVDTASTVRTVRPSSSKKNPGARNGAAKEGRPAGVVTDERDWTEEQRQAAYIARMDARTGVKA